METHKKSLKVHATPTMLSVHAGARQLLHVSPLVSRIVPDELAWTLEKPKAADGHANVQITLVKAEPPGGEAHTPWETTIAAPGGTFHSWTAEM